jgi:hypothetical protein
VVKPCCRGAACLIRYAEDGVAAFQYQEEADRFYQELGPRLGKCGLEMAVDKTRGIPLSHRHARGRTSFDFLGFELRWGTDRGGTPHLKRRTARKKLRNALKRFTAWCRETCRSRVRDVFKGVNRRSQRRSYTWTGFIELLRHFQVERPRLVGRPNTRQAAVEA